LFLRPENYLLLLLAALRFAGFLFAALRLAGFLAAVFRFAAFLLLAAICFFEIGLRWN